MKELLTVVVSWNRPEFLRRTLDSLFEQLGRSDTDVFVADNGSGPETIDVITSERRLRGYQLLGKNLGINGALEAVIPHDLPEQYRFLLVSDADMLYRQPIRQATELLDALAEVGGVSFQHSPEHPAEGSLFFAGTKWLTKRSERGCALVLRAADFQALRPLPVENLKDFDWWVVRDAPCSLQRRRIPIAVLPGGAKHLGWRQGDSTWQTIETPEFAEFKS